MLKEIVYIVNGDGSICEQEFVLQATNMKGRWKKFRDEVERRGGRVIDSDNEDYQEVKSKYQNQSKMAQSKVKSVQATGSWSSQHGLMYKFEYEFEDGTVMVANHKTETGNFKVGDLVDYEVTKDNEYGKQGKVSKPQETPQSTQHSTYSRPDNSDAILYQVCL